MLPSSAATITADVLNAFVRVITVCLVDAKDLKICCHDSFSFRKRVVDYQSTLIDNLWRRPMAVVVKVECRGDDPRARGLGGLGGTIRTP